MGIDSTASPEDEGTRKLIAASIQNIRLTKANPPTPSSACAALCSMVSAISPFSIITTIPRANPTTNATPSSSLAPSTKWLVRPFSPRRAITPITIADPRNSAPICAIHQPCDETPQIITAKVSANSTSTTD